MRRYIVSAVLIAAGFLSESVNAAPITYVCESASTRQIEITFDDLVIAGQTPATAEVKVTVSAIPKVKWTTSMFMGLKLPDVVFVQFRKETGPPDEINLEIAHDLRTAYGNLYARDEGLDLQDLDCARK